MERKEEKKERKKKKEKKEKKKKKKFWQNSFSPKQSARPSPKQIESNNLTNNLTISQSHKQSANPSPSHLEPNRKVTRCQDLPPSC